MQYPPLHDDLKEIIRRRLSPDTVFDDPQSLAACSEDASKIHFPPELVVRPACVEDVQELLRLANIHQFAVTPRGGGSGLAGGCLPDHGGAVLETTGLNRIRSIDRRNFTMEVEAGVISTRVRAAAAEAGMYYPPDPAGMELSTIGGNAATDAGGPACLKYGTTRDYILALEAVLPDGRLINTGVRTRKGVVGYDLTNLLIGSEGTLAVITALTLKLLPKPASVTGMTALFPDMGSAMDAVAAIMGDGHLPSALEFLDNRCLGLVRDLLQEDLPAKDASMLIIELDGPLSMIDDEVQLVEQLVRQAGAMLTTRLPDAAQRKGIWEMRRQVSIRVRDQAVVYYPEDIAVPISAIADLVSKLHNYEQRYQVEIYAFGHAGDGNIHLSVITRDADGRERARAAVRDLLTLTLELGGTISGEHGIGLAKREFIDMELPAHSLQLQRTIKNLFDPHSILNPGKVFPDL